MSSNLHGLIALVSAELNARVASVYPRGVPCLVDDDGDRQTASNTTPPVVRWRYLAGTGGSPKGTSWNPKRLYMRNVTVEARCWAADLEATEQLFQQLAASIWTISSGTIRFVSETWTPRGTLAKGDEVVTVWGPIPMALHDAEKLVGQAENAGHTAHFDADGDETCMHGLGSHAVEFSDAAFTNEFA